MSQQRPTTPGGIKILLGATILFAIIAVIINIGLAATLVGADDEAQARDRAAAEAAFDTVMIESGWEDEINDPGSRQILLDHAYASCEEYDQGTPLLEWIRDFSSRATAVDLRAWGAASIAALQLCPEHADRILEEREEL